MSNRTFDLQKIEEQYLGQSIERFLDEGGDVREYARLVFAGEVFPHEDPAAPELGVETEADLVEALEALARTVTAQALADQPRVLQVRTLDPHTTGRVFDGDEEIDTVHFWFYSEDRREWEKMADERLEEAGYRRVSEWRDDDGGVVADITRL